MGEQLNLGKYFVENLQKQKAMKRKKNENESVENEDDSGSASRELRKFYSWNYDDATTGAFFIQELVWQKCRRY